MPPRPTVATIAAAAALAWAFVTGTPPAATEPPASAALHSPWQPPPDRLPSWDLPRLRQPPGTQPAAEAPVDGVQAIWIDTLPYQGKPTKAFAYLGMPAQPAGADDAQPADGSDTQPANTQHKFPGVVLVHGGGGTAFADWVKTWTARGYAAIAVDLEGQIPKRDATGKAWIRTDTLGAAWGGGPARHGHAFGDCFDRPFEEQWAYHAVADTLLAFSLLAARPKVDSSRIGLVGISWGSVVCSIAAGVDDRPAFVVPQYIGGFLNLDSGWCEFMKPRPQTWAWDPANFYGSLPATRKTQWLWINGANDAYGTPPMMNASRRATGPHSWMTISPTLGHGHIWAADQVGEIYAFADAVTKAASPLARITKTAWRPDAVDIAWTGGPAIVKARFVYATLPQPEMQFAPPGTRTDWPKVKYTVSEADIAPGAGETPNAFTATLPRPTGMVTGWVNLVDDRGLAVSSELLPPHVP
jgi:hypothetical protein